MDGNGRVPGGPRGLQIRSALATVGVGGFDSHTFPLILLMVINLPKVLNLREVVLIKAKNTSLLFVNYRIIFPCHKSYWNSFNSSEGELNRLSYLYLVRLI